MEQLNAEKGQTFVIVTHDAGVGARCDRLVTMSRRRDHLEETVQAR